MSDDPFASLNAMLAEHAAAIDDVVDALGASAVAEFFIGIGTMIAAAYHVSDMNPEEVPTPSGEELS